MERIEVEAVEDRSRAEGGHAVLMLRNVASLPEDVTFRLRPLDGETLAPGARVLFEQDHVPIAVRETEDGVAMSIGPELAASPHLLPGTPVEVVIADPGLHGEFLWPAVAPAMRAKRRNIMTRRAPGDVTPPAPRSDTPSATLGQAGPTTTVALPTQATALAPAQTNDPQRISRDAFDFTEALGSRQQSHGGGEESEPDRVAEGNREPKPRSAASPGPGPVPARRSVIITSAAPQRPATIASHQHADEQAGLSPPGRTAGTPDRGGPAVGAGGSAHAGSDAYAATEPPPTTAGAGTPDGRPDARADARPVLPRSADDTPRSRSPVPGRYDAASAGAPRGLLSGAVGVAGVTALALALGGLIGMRVFDVALVKRSTLVAQPPAAVTSGPVKGPAQPGMASSRGIYEVFTAGPVSPRGTNAEAVSPAKALQLAHALLHGKDTERDTEEGIYWLKRYLAGTSGTEHARIALTQLGSAYAQPMRGARDMASARIAWELAAALGDTVAMCFLGAVHDNGIGVPADRAVATTWYQRAVAAGGSCASGGDAGPVPGK